MMDSLRSVPLIALLSLLVWSGILHSTFLQGANAFRLNTTPSFVGKIDKNSRQLCATKNEFFHAKMKIMKIESGSTSAKRAAVAASRRDWLLGQSTAAALSAFVISSSPSLAVAEVSDETSRVTSRMGGLLEKYSDVQRGVSLLAPSGWNKFEGEVGAYDIKWQDLVDPKENIKISSTPVKSTTTSV